MLNGENPRIFGDGGQSRDFIHVEDVARGFLNAMDASVSHETFNIGTGIPTSVNSVLRALNRHLGTSFPGEHVPQEPGELRYSVADISKARKKTRIPAAASTRILDRHGSERCAERYLTLCTHAQKMDQIDYEFSVASPYSASGNVTS